MDFLKGIYAPILFIIIVCLGSISGQLYLTPADTHRGFFTGDSYFLTCYSSQKDQQLKWTDNDGNNVPSSAERVHAGISEDESGLTLWFENMQKEDTGTYTCMDDQDSTSFELTVIRSVSFGDTPTEQHAPEGENATVICNIRSDSHVSILWHFQGKQMLHSEKIENSDKYRILDNHSLKIFNVSRHDAGNYTCQSVLVTSFGTQIKKFYIQLNVQYIPEIIGEPRVSHYARIGTLVQLPCNVTSEPKPMFQWLRDEMIVYNGTNGYTIFNTDNSSVLQLNLESETQLGVYICRASNALGEEEVTVNLKEGNPPQPPKLSVKDHNEDGVLKLRIEPTKDAEQEEELKTIGYKVEFTLASDETFENADSQEFKIEEPHVIRNLSINSEYLFRAAALNRAGYGEFSEHVRHKTKSQPEKASVVASASGVVASTLVIFTSIVFFRLF